MKTKEMAFTLPAVIAGSELLFFRARRLQPRYLIPYAMMLLIVPLSLVGTDKPVGAILSDVSDVTRVMTEMSRSTYLFTQFRVMVTYLRLLIFPFNQNFDYDYPVYSSLLDPAVFTALLLLVCLLLAAVYCAKKSFERYGDSAGPYRMTAFGIFWFFIAISVESSIIPIAGVILERAKTLNPDKAIDPAKVWSGVRN